MFKEYNWYHYIHFVAFYCFSFFNNSGYKDYLENAVAFNRKLNEERKMRLPYIDGQTGVAQRHYNSQRNRRERMPGAKHGQVSML
jgi:hypothetical protein